MAGGTCARRNIQLRIDNAWALSMQKKRIFGLSLHLKFFSCEFLSRLSRGKKKFGPKKRWTFFHETTRTPREVFGSHHGKSLSSLLVEVAITPPLPSRQAITCGAMPSVAAGRWRQRGSNVQLGSAAAASSLAARRRSAWQRGIIRAWLRQPPPMPCCHRAPSW